MLDLDTWRMLQRGNTAEPGATSELLGRDPRRVSEFTSRWSVEELRVSGMMSLAATRPADIARRRLAGGRCRIDGSVRRGREL